MKKTLTVNLNGRVFNIDEDAYELLDSYLRNLRIYFRKEEGFTEIIADFEARIEELLSERVRLGHEVISIEQVETVIKQVGKPEDFGDVDDRESEAAERSKKQESGYYDSDGKKPKKTLYRDVDNKMLGGVFSGIAAYFGWDVTLVRLVAVIFLICLSFGYGSGFWLYFIMWIVVPAAKTAQQKLEMRGEEVNLQNIGKVVSEETTAPETKNANKGCIGWGLDFIVSLLKVFLVGIGILVGLPVVFALVLVLIVVFAVLLGLGGGMIALPFGIFNNGLADVTFTHPTLALISAILIAAIPIILLIYSIVAHFAKLTPLPKSIKLTGLLVWIIALAVLICSGFNVNWDKNNFRHGHWGWTFNNSDSNVNRVEGNGQLTDRMEVIPSFETIKLNENLVANIQLEQSTSTESKILINGESNIIDKIEWSVSDNQLNIFVKDRASLNPHSDIIIKVITPSVKGIKIESVGSVTVPGKFQTDNLNVEIDGAGNFQADSLYCRILEADVEGVGNMEVAGKATEEARFKLKGAGRIKSIDFEASTIYAGVEGVGSITCNPVKSLDAKVDGIGKITYKNEPATKNVQMNGLGKISKE